MDCQQRKCCPIARHGPRPDQGRADVAFYHGEQGGAERVTQRLFGKKLTRCEYATLAGAPRDALLEVGTWRGQLYLELRGTPMRLFQAVLRVRRGENGPVLVEDGFCFSHPSMQGKHLGRRVFHRQLCYAQALGIVGVETFAERRPDDNGYYHWPRFGFDGPLSAALRRKLPEELAVARRVLDLMRSRAGRQWWRRHGVAMRVRFDMAEESRSWQVLRRHLGPAGT